MIWTTKYSLTILEKVSDTLATNLKKTQTQFVHIITTEYYIILPAPLGMKHYSITKGLTV